MLAKQTLKQPIQALGLGASHRFRDLLVYQDETNAAANAMSYAEALTAEADGKLTGLMFGFMAPYPMTVYMEASPDIWQAAQRTATEETNAIEKRISDRFEHSSPGVELRRKDILGGDAGHTLAFHGRYADAVVVGWSGDSGSELERDLFEGVLFEAGRPAILVPEYFKAKGAPKTILIGWNPQREATRAVHDALALLEAADSVYIVMVAQGGGQDGEENAGAGIARHLARHDIKAEVKYVPSGGQTIAAVLRDEARYLGADLIVMGGYGHSRLKEWILGGATRDMLTKVEVPVLMSH